MHTARRSVMRGSSEYSSPDACTACARASAMQRSARAPPHTVAALVLSSIFSSWCTMSVNLSCDSSPSSGAGAAAATFLRRPPSLAWGSSAAVDTFQAVALKEASCCSVASLKGAMGRVVLEGLPTGKMLSAWGSTSPNMAFHTSSLTCTQPPAFILQSTTHSCKLSAIAELMQQHTKHATRIHFVQK